MKRETNELAFENVLRELPEDEALVIGNYVGKLNSEIISLSSELKHLQEENEQLKEERDKYKNAYASNIEESKWF